MFPLFATGVVYTGGKFAAGVVDNSGNWPHCIVDTRYQQCLGKWWKNMPPVSLIPVVHLEFETVLMEYSGAGGNVSASSSNSCPPDLELDALTTVNG